jgi:YggT family protein
VSGLLCTLSKILLDLVNLYSILLFVYAVLSWIPDLRGRWTYYLAAVIEPVLMPIRRVIPPLGGLDLAFLVLLLVLQLAVRPFLQQEVLNACLRFY